MILLAFFMSFLRKSPPVRHDWSALNFGRLFGHKIAPCLASVGLSNTLVQYTHDVIRKWDRALNRANKETTVNELHPWFNITLLRDERLQTRLTCCIDDDRHPTLLARTFLASTDYVSEPATKSPPCVCKYARQSQDNCGRIDFAQASSSCFVIVTWRNVLFHDGNCPKWEDRGCQITDILQHYGTSSEREQAAIHRGRKWGTYLVDAILKIFVRNC